MCTVGQRPWQQKLKYAYVYVYDAGAVAASADPGDGEVERCAVCGKSEENGQWYGCDRCHHWYHSPCLSTQDRNKAASSLKTASVWMCSWCTAVFHKAQRGFLTCSVCSKAQHETTPGWIVCNTEDCCMAVHQSCLPPGAGDNHANWRCPICKV